MAPDNWLPDKIKCTKPVRLVIPEGMEPVNRLLPRCSPVRAVSEPICDGIAPDRRLPVKLRLVKPVSEPISVGMVPYRYSPTVPVPRERRVTRVAAVTPRQPGEMLILAAGSPVPQERNVWLAGSPPSAAGRALSSFPSQWFLIATKARQSATRGALLVGSST